MSRREKKESNLLNFVLLGAGALSAMAVGYFLGKEDSREEPARVRVPASSSSSSSSSSNRRHGERAEGESASPEADVLYEESDATDTDQPSTCVICLERQPTMVFLDCRHVPCCRKCAEELAKPRNNNPQPSKEQPVECPVCRQPVKRMMQVYRV